MSRHSSRSRPSASLQKIASAVAEALESRRLLTASPYDNRGWASVIVDGTLAPNLTAKLQQLKQDLIGDGWNGVFMHDGDSSDAAPRMDDEH